MVYTFFFFLVAFWGSTHGTWRFSGEGSNRSCRCRPIPQPQQLGIQAASETHTTAPGNAGSLTHRARPGMEPATSWIIVRFVSAAPHREPPVSRSFFRQLYKDNREYACTCVYQHIHVYTFHSRVLLDRATTPPPRPDITLTHIRNKTNKSPISLLS